MSLVLSTLAASAALAVPALVLADVLRGRDRSRWVLAGAFGVALPTVSWLVYLLTLAFNLPYSPALVLAAGALFLPLLFVRRLRVAEYLRAAMRAGRPSSESLAVAAVLAVGFLAALLLFRNEAFSNTCTHQAVSTVVGIPLGEPPEGQSPAPREPLGSMLHLQTGEREGVYAQIAVFASLWGFLGLRLFHAVTVLFCGLFGFLIARRLLPASAPARVVTAVLFLAAPAAADLLWNDVNTVSFLVACSLLWLMVEETTPPWLAGLATALVVGVRHHALLSVAAPLWWVARRSDRPLRAGAVFTGVFAVALLPVLAHHAVAFGSPFAFESFNEHAPSPHNLFGYEFTLNAMLNYPFTEQVVRTPFNALPLFLLQPVWALSRVGLALGALGAIGLVVVLRRGGAPLVAAAAWIVPYLGVLLVNENWMQVEKLAAIAPVVPFALLTMGAGLQAVLVLPGAPRRAAVLGGAMLALWAVWAAALTVRVPADARFHVANPLTPPEREEYLAAERALVAPRLAPAFEVLRQVPPTSPFRDLGEALLAPRYEQRLESAQEELFSRIQNQSYTLALKQAGIRSAVTAAPEGAMRRLSVSLDRPWVEGAGWVRDLPDDAAAAPDELVIDLRRNSGSFAHRRFPHPWFPGSLASLHVFHRRGVTYVTLSLPSRFETLTFDADGRASLAPVLDLENEIPPNRRFTLVTPREGKVRFIETLSVEPGRAYAWHLGAGTPAQQLSGPARWRSD